LSTVCAYVRAFRIFHIVMTLTATELWQHLLDRAKRDLPEQTFRTWLEPVIPVEFTGDRLVVRVADQFAADWNESKFAAQLAAYAPMILGHPCQIDFRPDEERRQRSQIDLFAQPTTTVNRSAADSAVQRSFAPPLLSARYTFEQFVIGKSNEVAAAAAYAVSQAPGKVYNPLFIYGITGVGKTHLMQAVAHELLKHTPQLRISNLGAEQFTNDYINAIQTRTTNDFRRRFRETDLLLVDDVHFLKGKEATQEEFFHTFNTLYENGRQIIMTSDRPPSEIPGIEARLVTRFQWGMVADIELPDLELRIAILRKKAEIDQLQQAIPDDVIRFLAENIRSSVRELEGAVIRLLAFSSLRRREINIALAQEALRDKLRRDNNGVLTEIPAITPERIQEIVAAQWHVTAEGLRSKFRTKTLTIPRQAAMYLCRDLLGLQLVEIGHRFGNRDHSTVIHSLERAEVLLEEDSTFRARVSEARKQLTS
jgi:chromosomal replication initiator protein